MPPHPSAVAPAVSPASSQSPSAILHEAGAAISEFSVVSVVLEQPGSGSVAPLAKWSSIMPSPSSSLPFAHAGFSAGGGGGAVAPWQLPTGPRSSATSPLGR